MFEVDRRTRHRGGTPQEEPPDPLDEERQRILIEVHGKYGRELINNLGEVDRDEAERVMHRTYRYIGMEPPKMFLWLDEPEEALVAATLLTLHRLNNLPPMFAATKYSAQPIGHRMRRKLMASGGVEPTKQQLVQIRLWLPSLEHLAYVFRDRLGGRGLLNVSIETPYALDSWLDAFLALEEQFAFQSELFGEIWDEAAREFYTLKPEEHKETLMRLRAIGRGIMGDTIMWEWEEPAMLSGSMEAYYAALAELYHHNIGTAPGDKPKEGIELLMQHVRHCGWCFPFDDFCIMAERPEQLFTLAEIDAERNIEARRLLIELYGVGKYLHDRGARLVQKDEYGELFWIPQRDDETLTVVKVINSTPEPDGTYKEYFLRVPPGTKSAREGVAWSFNMDENAYKPSIET